MKMWKLKSAQVIPIIIIIVGTLGGIVRWPGWKTRHYSLNSIPVKDCTIRNNKDSDNGPWCKDCVKPLVMVYDPLPQVFIPAKISLLKVEIIIIITMLIVTVHSKWIRFSAETLISSGLHPWIFDMLLFWQVNSWRSLGNGSCKDCSCTFDMYTIGNVYTKDKF